MTIVKFFEIHKNALDGVDLTICKAHNSITLILKVEKLGWIEYTDRDIFTASAYLGFHLERKVNKYITNVFQSLFFLSTRSLFVGWSCKLKVHRTNPQTIRSCPERFSTDTLNNNNIFFLLYFFGFFYFSIFFIFFCFLLVCECVFGLKPKIYILIHIGLFGQVSEKNNFIRLISGN